MVDHKWAVFDVSALLFHLINQIETSFSQKKLYSFLQENEISKRERAVDPERKQK